MDNYHVVLKVKLKRIQTLLTAVSGPHKRGNRHVNLNFCWYLRLPLRLWLLNSQYTNGYCDIHNRCETDFSGNNSWKYHKATKLLSYLLSYHKIILGVTPRSTQPTHPRHVLSRFDGTHPRAWRIYAMTPKMKSRKYYRYIVHVI